ncbi:MAG: hypothetical protein M3R36_10425 [Bacteroidota bacterium]|nr:hypothetical protein [Bacteroidota bacterium]
MKASLKWYFALIVLVIGLNYSTSSGKDYGYLLAVQSSLDSIFCQPPDSTCLNIAWGNHVINDAKFFRIDTTMNRLLQLQEQSILSLDSMAIAMNYHKRIIDSAGGYTKSLTASTQYHNVKALRTEELKYYRKVDQLIRKIEYLVDKITLNGIVRRPL